MNESVATVNAHAHQNPSDISSTGAPPRTDSETISHDDDRPADDFKADSISRPGIQSSPKSSVSANSARPVNGENTDEEDGAEPIKTESGDGSK